MAKETVMVFVAHSDDDSIGMGGTIAKYAKEGKKVISVIFCYGAASLPWLKEDIVAIKRIRETKKIQKILGLKEIFFLGLQDPIRKKEIKSKKAEKNIMKLIRKYKPSKIFTHSKYDIHNDHRAVSKLVVSAVDKMNYKHDVYVFQVWNHLKILSLLKKHTPKLVVDISKEFQTKLKAIKAYKSQKIYTYQLLPYVHFDAITEGRKAGFRYAEVFEKIR
ncbi:MAG: PIG-L family deacetylase [Candidatus Woesearchaeota archaeon]|nr:MAG: PIG-L family deacetylase [Candidatus Woesearchaeota archaeon]